MLMLMLMLSECAGYDYRLRYQTMMDEVVEEGSHVQNEGVPHEVEGGVSPVEVVIVEQVLECDAVREDISERQNGVEEKELGDLDHLDDFAWGYWDVCKFIALTATNIQFWE